MSSDTQLSLTELDAANGGFDDYYPTDDGFSGDADFQPEFQQVDFQQAEFQQAQATGGVDTYSDLDPRTYNQAAQFGSSYFAMRDREIGDLQSQVTISQDARNAAMEYGRQNGPDNVDLTEMGEAAANAAAARAEVEAQRLGLSREATDAFVRDAYRESLAPAMLY